MPWLISISSLIMTVSVFFRLHLFRTLVLDYIREISLISRPDKARQIYNFFHTFSNNPKVTHSLVSVKDL